MIDRRKLLVGGATVAALAGLSKVYAARETARVSNNLVPDPKGQLDLPPGFSAKLISTAGKPMTNGQPIPGRFDGMAAFAADAGRTVLIRNHELWPESTEGSFLSGKAPPGLPLFSTEGIGGTTTLVLAADGVTVEQEFFSLAGTVRNCCGGPTPWGSWLSCEEARRGRSAKLEEGHGWVFEVPSSATGPVVPVPLKAMGRFNHEAAAVDRRTGIVYMTEDLADGLFYRFIPSVPGKLSVGGQLQACAVKGLSTSANRDATWATGRSLPVQWIDLDDPDSPDDDLRQRGATKGATVFVRGEGLAMAADNSVFLSCTEGGANAKGQIFHYTPGRGNAGTLKLFLQPDDIGVLDMPDNMVVAPWGALVVCEDGDADNFLRLVTKDGRILTLARNAHPDRKEFAGACFSPDGKTLYVNVQTPGFTYAIRGPWASFTNT